MVLFSLILSGVYLADLLTKIAVRRFMPLGSEIKLLPFFSLTHVENTGIAFGLFQGNNGALIVMGVAVMGFIGWLSYRLYHEDRPSALALAGILGGALGNLTDRLVYGRVTDFLDAFIGRHHWPTFNVADSAICVGAALLVIRSFRSPPKS